MRTTSDTVIIRQDDAPEFSYGGIALASTAQRKPPIGVVIAVGPGRTEKGRRTTKYVSEVNVGDHVFYHAVAAREVEIDGETFISIEAPNVLGVIE